MLENVTFSRNVFQLEVNVIFLHLTSFYFTISIYCINKGDKAEPQTFLGDELIVKIRNSAMGPSYQRKCEDFRLLLM